MAKSRGPTLQCDLDEEPSMSVVLETGKTAGKLSRVYGVIPTVTYEVVSGIVKVTIVFPVGTALATCKLIANAIFQTLKGKTSEDN